MPAPTDSEQQHLLSLLGQGAPLTEEWRDRLFPHQARARSDSLLAAVPDLLFRFDAEGRFAEHFAAPEAWLFVPPQQFLGRHYETVLPPKVSARLGEAIAEARRTKLPQEFEYEGPLRGGGSGTFLARVVALADGGSGVLCRDITTQRQLEAALREHQRTLESRVEGRTASLRDSNDSLRTEIALRTLVERDLRASEERLRRLIETAQEGIGMLDDQANIIFLNKRIAELFGYPPEEIQGRSLFAFIRPEDHSEARSRLQQIEGGVTRTFDFRFQRKDGSDLWGICSCTPIRDSQGRHTGILGMLTDITDRKRVETALRERERELNEAQRLARIGSFAWDAASDTTTWSEELYRITGHDLLQSPPSFKGHARFYSPQDWNRLVKLALSRTPGSPSYKLDTQLKTARGEIRWISIHGEAEFDAAGKLALLRGTIQDITERKLIENTLIQRESELREAQRVAKTGNWEWNLESDRLSWSPQTYKIFGRDPSLPPPSMKERAVIYTPESWSQLKALLRRALKTGKPYWADFEIRRPDGTTAWVNGHGEAVRNEKGRIVALRGTAQDITERKYAEIILRRSVEGLAEAQRLAQIGSWRLNLKTGASSWSKELFLIAGLSPSRRSPSLSMQRPFLSKLNWQRLEAAVKKTTKTGAPFEFEMELLCRNRNGAWVVIRGELEKPHHGKARFLRGTVQDITERKDLKEQILRATENEQRRIAQDLHDGLCQKLIGIRFMCDALRQRLRPGSGEVAQTVSRLSKLLDSSLEEARGVARGLHPVKPEANGLISALTELARTVSEMFHVACRFRPTLPVMVHDHVVATHLFRIAQEATSNAIRHGKARRITIRLAPLAQGILHLTVNSDGRAISKSSRANPGLGLQTMHYRASLIGALLEIEPGRHGGTRLSCRCPIPAPPRRRIRR